MPTGSRRRSARKEPNWISPCAVRHLRKRAETTPLSDPPDQAPNVLIWGTYDLGKPRTRLMIRAIRKSGAAVAEIHRPVWEGAEDKSVLSASEAARRARRLLAAYPALIWRFLRAPRPDAIVVGYLGHLDVLVLWPFARLRGVPVVWDAFLSLYDTVVDDRALVSKRNPLAALLRAWEWLACRAASLVVLDTAAQANLFRRLYGLDDTRLASVFVGAEDEAFRPAPGTAGGARPVVLFYGQFIPLHGITTIVDAARTEQGRAFDWVLIGTGQEAARVRASMASDRPPTLEWIEWVPYEDLSGRIASADVCLGVFGKSEKAGRVIPNKVFQILSAGKPLVTRDGPGIRELVSRDASGIRLVAPDDPMALAAAVDDLLTHAPFPQDLHADLRRAFDIEALSRQWTAILRRVTGPSHHGQQDHAPRP